MTHTLKIQHTGTHNPSATPDAHGNYVVNVVRKGLSETEITPGNLRVNPTTHVVERTPDGGTTWTPSPGDDPRHNDAARKPPRGAGSTRQCDAAANMVDKFKSVIDEIEAGVTLLQGLNFAIGVIGDFFPELLLLPEIISEAISALLSIGATALTSTFTSTVYDDLTTLIACNIASDGSVSAAQLAAIQAEILSRLGSAVSAAFNYTMTALGEVGLSNAGATGSVSGACGSCSWCWEWDFTIDAQGWSQFASYGTYVSGQGWASVPVGGSYSLILVNSEAQSFSWDFVGITVGYNIDPTFDGARVIALGTTNGVTFPGLLAWTPIATPDPNTYTDITHETVVNPIYLNPNGGSNTVTATVKALRLTGTGTMPIFTHGHAC